MENALANALVVLLLYVAVLIVIFFLTRKFWLWYFKLDKIERHLAALAGVSNSRPCSRCKHEVAGSFIACPYCGERAFWHCGDCKKKLEPKFKLCPYCGSRNVIGAADMTRTPSK